MGERHLRAREAVTSRDRVECAPGSSLATLGRCRLLSHRGGLRPWLRSLLPPGGTACAGFEGSPSAQGAHCHRCDLRAARPLRPAIGARACAAHPGHVAGSGHLALAGAPRGGTVAAGPTWYGGGARERPPRVRGALPAIRGRHRVHKRESEWPAAGPRRTAGAAPVWWQHRLCRSRCLGGSAEADGDPRCDDWAGGASGVRGGR